MENLVRDKLIENCNKETVPCCPDFNEKLSIFKQNGPKYYTELQGKIVFAPQIAWAASARTLVVAPQR